MNNSNSSFMVVNFPLNVPLDGFDGLADLGAGSTIVFTQIPSGVEVFFSVDNNSASKMKALQGMQIKTNHGAIFFTTVGTSSVPMIVTHYSSDDMTIEMPPISTFDSLSAFGGTAANQLSKAMNPYDNGVRSGGSASPASVTTILTKTLACDSIDVFLTGKQTGSIPWVGYIMCKLDGVVFGIAGAYNDSAGNSPFQAERFTLNGVRGAVLTLEAVTYAANHVAYYSLIEKNLKA